MRREKVPGLCAGKKSTESQARRAHPADDSPSRAGKAEFSPPFQDPLRSL